jgi:hypothetical protein
MVGKQFTTGKAEEGLPQRKTKEKVRRVSSADYADGHRLKAEEGRIHHRDHREHGAEDENAEIGF